VLLLRRGRAAVGGPVGARGARWCWGWVSTLWISTCTWR